MIEHYRFGEMVIDGQRYRSDLVILPDGTVVDGWQRREGHRLFLADLPSGVLSSGAATLVAGSGFSGRMVPAADLEKQLKKKGIELICAPCEEALSHYNRLLQDGHPVAGCFHLTC